MPPQDDGANKAEALPADSNRLFEEGRQLRNLSDRLIAEIEALRQLEMDARQVPVGSPEFERLSHAIAARARGVYRMTGEQETLAGDVQEQAWTINDVAAEDR